MALKRGNIDTIPEEAVLLSEQDAIDYQMKLVRSWTETNDNWIFKYGSGILGFLSASSAIYINSHFRLRLRLGSIGRISSMLPVVTIPSIVAAAFHESFIVPDVLLQKTCSVCLEIRAATIQCSISTLFPLVFSPITALTLASRYHTYKLPDVTNPMSVVRLMAKFTKPISNVLLGILAAQAVAAALITYQEQKSILNIQEKLDELFHS